MTLFIAPESAFLMDRVVYCKNRIGVVEIEISKTNNVFKANEKCLK